MLLIEQSSFFQTWTSRALIIYFRQTSLPFACYSRRLKSSLANANASQKCISKVIDYGFNNSMSTEEKETILYEESETFSMSTINDVEIPNEKSEDFLCCSCGSTLSNDFCPSIMSTSHVQIRAIPNLSKLIRIPIDTMMMQCQNIVSIPDRTKMHNECFTSAECTCSASSNQLGGESTSLLLVFISH